jgi:hypothetical protein
MVGARDGRRASRRRLGDTTVQTPTGTATTRTATINLTIRRRMADLARRSQVLHLDPRSVQAIRMALYN